MHRRRGALALVGAGALAVAVAYIWRAATGGGALGYVIAAVMLPVAVLHLAAWWDARVPLLVADRTGLRLRDGRSWTGSALGGRADPAADALPAAAPRRQARGGRRRRPRARAAAVLGRPRRRTRAAGRLAAAGRPAHRRVDRRTRPATRARARAPAAEADDARTRRRRPRRTNRRRRWHRRHPSREGSRPRRRPRPAAPTTVVAASGTPERRVTRVLPPQPARAGEGTGVARADVVHQSAAPPTSDERELRDAAPGRVPLVLETPTPAEGTPEVLPEVGGRRPTPSSTPSRPPRRSNPSSARSWSRRATGCGCRSTTSPSGPASART